MFNFNYPHFMHTKIQKCGVLEFKAKEKEFEILKIKEKYLNDEILTLNND